MAFYKGSQKRLEFVSKFLLLIVTITLASFLIALGERVIYDINSWSSSPSMNEFKSIDLLKVADGKIIELDKRIERVDERLERAYLFRNKARRKYDSEKTSFNNWIKARRTIGSPVEDKAIRNRAVKLDKIREIENNWQDKINALSADKAKIVSLKNIEISKKRDIERRDREKYREAYKKYSIKVFIYRLMFVLPVLFLAVILFLKFRSSRIKPIVWGYIIFALYAFFVGLIPYMPSFGGYIRYTVGVTLTIFIGLFLIKRLKIYTEKKKAELAQSMDERVKKVKSEMAVKAYKSHSCPSCEKDFLMNNWQPKTKLVKEVFEKDAPDYCQHCGLMLFTKCTTCGSRKFAHFPFCSSCGAKVNS